MFKFPSSDVPSTPDARRGGRDDFPSTTPAGPPPTNFTSHSFTPAGPPPASVFGSSFTGPTSNLPISKPAFAPSGQLNNPSLHAPFHSNPLGAQQPPANTRGGFRFAVPSSSPPRHGDDGVADGDAYSEDAEGESMEEDDYVDMSGRPVQPAFKAMASSHSSERPPRDAYSTHDSPRGLKRSRYGEVMGSTMRSSRGGQIQSRDSAMPNIAKGLAAGLRVTATIEAPDDLVLFAETVLSDLDTAVQSQMADDKVNAAAHRLGQDWEKYISKDSRSGAIGPKDQSPLAKANYIASLLLQLHHPGPAKEAPATTSTSRYAHRRQLSKASALQPVATTNGQSSNVPVPKALLEWLNAYHNPYPEDLPEVLHFRPSATAHERFWDLVFTTMLRGNIAATIQLLSNADFSHADTAFEDGYDQPGYRGKQLNAVQFVVSQCVDLLKTCPAVTEGDWDVRNPNWTLFRNRVRHALDDLESFAEEDSADRNDMGLSTNVFQSSKLGRSRNNMSFSTASRRAESKVPWTIYEQLRAIYGQLQGRRDETLLSAQDWLEATIYLTVWWDGEDDDISRGSLAASRRSIRQTQRTRQVDVTPLIAYRAQLLYAFSTVTDEPEDPVLGVNTLDAVQVGLACIFEDDVESVIGLLSGWSMPVAAAVTELAGPGRWLPEARPRSTGFMDGFDQDDLMVLSHGQEQQSSHGLTRDDLLIDYAGLLAKRDRFSSGNLNVDKEGWEMACRVLSRLDSVHVAHQEIGHVLSKLTLDSAKRVDMILTVCGELGLTDQVRSISERYANSVANTTQSYGDALIYYARAHSTHQLKSTIDLLMSLCIVRSSAFPPSTSLDPQLDSLLNNQRNTLSQLARVDVEAAQLIATHLSGYATLRRFYDLRDEGDEEEGVKKSGLRPLARKREAAKALLALIESASDSIRGGLYDAETEAVVQVDTLLTLLGEALPLMGQAMPLLKPAQLMLLLRATEDLQAVTSRVYEQADALFKSAMANYHGSVTPSPQDLAKSMSMSVSNLTGSSYGMITSQGSLVSADGATGSAEDIKRGWDWRKGIAVMAGKNAQGTDVLRVLRVQIAKETAKAYAGS